MGIKTIIAIIVILMIVWGAWAAQYWLWLPAWGEVPPLAERGAWGDTFGALNALFSAFAFSAVLLTLWVQQRQINDAQHDLHRQRFDDSFFRLLTLLREVRSELRYTRTTLKKPLTTTGARALRGAFEDARHHLIGKRPVDRDLTRTEVANIYASNVHKQSEAYLGPYFRLIYTILRKIDADPYLSEKEKISYGNLLRGQLGSPEIGLLALNGLTKDSKDLTRYLNRFRMLRYLPPSPIRTCVESWYEPSAFEPRND